MTIGATAPTTGFTVSDSLLPGSALTVRATSSNPTLVPAGHIIYGGGGGNRTIQVLPAANQTGTATITMTLSDFYGNHATTSFAFTVNATASPAATPAVAQMGPIPLVVKPAVATVSQPQIATPGVVGAVAAASGKSAVPTATPTVTAHPAAVDKAVLSVSSWLGR
jgi:hypothetical protein